MKKHYLIYITSAILLILIGIKGYDLLKEKNEVNRILRLPENFKLSEKEGIIFGNPEAGLSVFVYANYKCKYCIKFFKEQLPFILEEYDGKVKIIVKLMPFSATKEEMEAYQMALSVYKYGVYEPFHNLLLKDQEIMHTPGFKDYMVEIMNLNYAIANCFTGGKMKTIIEDNNKEFIELGLKGTPTFIIANEIYTGYIELNKIKNLIEVKLRQNKL